MQEGLEGGCKQELSDKFEVIRGQGIGIYDEVKQYLLRLYKGVAFGRQPPSFNKRILHQVASVQLVGTPWRFHAGR